MPVDKNVLLGVLQRPVTAAEIDYIMQRRLATLIVWDALNPEAPSPKVPLRLPNAGPHYLIYDQGCRLVAVPKDLFSHQRTPEDSVRASLALADEVCKRGWPCVELAGTSARMARACFIRIQGLTNGVTEVLHYEPTEREQRLCQTMKPSTPSAPGRST